MGFVPWSSLFQARPVGCVGPTNACGSPVVRVNLVYANLWKMDGGYGPASFFCSDKHIGDNQTVSVVAVSEDDGLTFRPESVHIGRWTWPSRSGRGPAGCATACCGSCSTRRRGSPSARSIRMPARRVCSATKSSG